MGRGTREGKGVVMWVGVPGSEKALLCGKGYQGVKRRCYVGRGTRE